MFNWKEIESLPAYQAKPDSEKLAVRRDYFESVLKADPDFEKLPETDRRDIEREFAFQGAPTIGAPPERPETFMEQAQGFMGRISDAVDPFIPDAIRAPSTEGINAPPAPPAGFPIEPTGPDDNQSFAGGSPGQPPRGDGGGALTAPPPAAPAPPTIGDLLAPAAETIRGMTVGTLPEGLGYLQKPMDTAVDFWGQLTMTPEEETRLAQQNPNLMAAGYAAASLIPEGTKAFSPTEREAFANSSPEEQRIEILGETAGWMLAPVIGKGMGKAAELLAKRFPWLTKDITAGLRDSNWFRMLTNRERGVAMQGIEGMKAAGLSEAEILRSLRKSGNMAEFERFKAEAIQRRATGEGSAPGEPITTEPPPAPVAPSAPGPGPQPAAPPAPAAPASFSGGTVVPFPGQWAGQQPVTIGDVLGQGADVIQLPGTQPAALPPPKAKLPYDGPQAAPSGPTIRPPYDAPSGEVIQLGTVQTAKKAAADHGLEFKGEQYGVFMFQDPKAGGISVDNLDDLPAAVEAKRREFQKDEPDTQAQKAKEPWEMTRDEWLRSKADSEEQFRRMKIPGEVQGVQRFKAMHRIAVESAINSGKAVPPEVLKDYPDIKPADPEKNGFGEEVRTFFAEEEGKQVADAARVASAIRMMNDAEFEAWFESVAPKDPAARKRYRDKTPDKYAWAENVERQIIDAVEHLSPAEFIKDIGESELQGLVEAVGKERAFNLLGASKVEIPAELVDSVDVRLPPNFVKTGDRYVYREAEPKATGMLPQEPAAKPLTKKEKAAAEYSQFVESLTPEQRAAAGDLIIDQPENPGMQLWRVRKALAGDVPPTPAGGGDLQAPGRPPAGRPDGAPPDSAFKPKVSKPKESKVSTLRGRIKQFPGGGIAFGKTMRGEVKAMPAAVRIGLSRKNGEPWDIAEQTLRDEGWLYQHENLFDVLTIQGILKRGRIGDEPVTAAQKEQVAAQKWEKDYDPPPDGEYVQVKAGELPEGGKLTIIDGNSAEGWDTYKVIDSTPFSVTLQDGEIIELEAWDQVEVLKADLDAAGGKAAPKALDTSFDFGANEQTDGVAQGGPTETAAAEAPVTTDRKSEFLKWSAEHHGLIGVDALKGFQTQGDLYGRFMAEFHPEEHTLNLKPESLDLKRSELKAKARRTQQQGFGFGDPNQRNIFGEATSAREDAELRKKNGTTGAPSGFASAGQYATNIPRIIEMPEIVQLAKALLKGKYPKVKEFISRNPGVTGMFMPRGDGEIKLKAGMFKDADQAAATLAHEVGHLVDYLPDRDIKRGNILGRIASLKRHMKHTIPEKPGAPGELTAEDRKRIKEEARKLIQGTRMIDEEITRTLPITPDDVLAIWRATGDAIQTEAQDLYRYIAGLSGAQKKSIVKEALKGRVPSELQRYAKTVTEKTGRQIPVQAEVGDLEQVYKDLIEAEIRKRKLFDVDTITDELRRLTHTWKPFDASNDPKYTKYRYSSVELYADAISALVNAPQLVKGVAPTFYEAFFNYLEAKPEVLAHWDAIQDMIRSGSVAENRVSNIRRMFRRGDDAWAKSLEDSTDYRGEAAREMIDANWLLLKKIKKVGEQNIPPRGNPRYRLEAMNYSGSEGEAYMTDIFHSVVKPLEAGGVDWDEFGEYLFHNRVATERSELANPLGWTPKLSDARIAEMEAGPTGEALQAAKKEFRRIHEGIIQKVDEAGIFDSDLIKTMRDAENYATFSVVDYMEQKAGKGVGAKIYRQIGTLNEIANPATATIMKDIAMIKSVNRQLAARSVAEFMQGYFPDEIKPADTRWVNKRHEVQEPTEPGVGMVAFMERGKLKAFYVPKGIAEMFDRNPVESWVISKVLRAVAQPFRTLFTEINYGFWLFNIWRDYFRAARNLPKASLVRFAPAYLQGIKPAFKSVFGIPDPVVTEMQKGNMLISIADVRGLRPEDKQVERLLKMYHMKPAEWESKILKPIGKLFTFFTNIGRALERTTKVASYNHLKKYFPDMSPQELGHMVRSMGGSPDFLRLGRAYPIYNNLLLFSNAAKEGYRGDWEALVKSPAEFIWKTFKYNWLPKLVMFAGAAGLMGDEVQDIFDGASEYDKTNYMIIPIGLTAAGKSVYLRFPVDETGRLMGGIMWKTLNHEKLGWSDAATGMFDYMAGQAPTVNPGLEALVSAVQYASGHNPYDWFRSRYAIREDVFEAGGKRSHLEFAKWMANKSGATLIYRFKSEDVAKVKSELEQVLGAPVVSNTLGRFLKVSDTGIREDIRRAKERVKRENTADLLDAKDALYKIVNGEALTKEDQMALMAHPDILTRGFTASFARKYGNVYLEEYLRAQSTEEKAAVIEVMAEKHNSNVKNERVKR